MSASLVGSEMCIRDRYAFMVWPPNTRTLRVSEPHACSPLQKGGSRTVSYTHLTLPTICSV
eukprot:10973163-Alexandrium_andersonii.AAC.1